MRSLPSFKTLALAGILAVLVAVTAGTVLATQPTDISGPCDEAEHANDPECSGVIAPNDDDRRVDDGDDDISGPCDEAEHANDPRCTGAADDDSSGPGPGGRAFDDNSGPGNGDDGDDDHSGPGHGDDDDDDDDDDDSGSGGDDD